jgi:hypothetical protein
MSGEGIHHRGAGMVAPGDPAEVLAADAALVLEPVGLQVVQGFELEGTEDAFGDGDGDGVRHLFAACDLGRGQQRRTRLHPDQQFPAE